MRRLPGEARVVEVGPRDGFQMEAEILPTELKVEVIDALAASGIREIEAVSFVHPRVIPQMADAAEVMARVSRPQGVRFTALVPNLKGAEAAIEAGLDALRLVVCSTETYNRKNVGLTIDESVEVFAEIVRAAEAAGLEASTVLGVAFGCPFEGEVSEVAVVDLARRLVALGSRRIGLADSAGLANPRQVHRLVAKVSEALPETPLWLHLHDTRGLGLANAVAALEEGVDTFDTSLGGLGGCPIMRGASGNIATEDFVYMAAEMGIETGVDLDRVRAASRRLEEHLGRTLPSRILAAGTNRELYAANRDESPASE